MTVYQIHPSIQVAPKDKPVSVLLAMCNGNVALVIGGSTVLTLTPRGSIYRFRMSEGAEEALGLSLNAERNIRVECEIGPGVLTSDAVQAERKRCLDIVQNCPSRVQDRAEIHRRIAAGDKVVDKP